MLSIPNLIAVFGLLSLVASTACTGGKIAGDECPEIDFTPTGGSPYGDAAFRTIIDACRPDRISTWDGFGRPELTDECTGAILDFVPLEPGFRTATVGAAVDVRENLARAFHALIFMPVADTGDIFGAVAESDYCESNYDEFFGAVRTTGLSAREYTAADYDAGVAAVNTHLVRFILERTDQFAYTDEFDAFYAREEEGEIQLARSFGDLNEPIDMASIIVHEARHIETGFPDGSTHVECLFGEASGREACDEWVFGAFGSQLSYLDAVLKGSLLSVLPDGGPWLSEARVESIVNNACVYYQGGINEQESGLASLFGSGTDCSTLYEDVRDYLAAIYSIPAETIVFRE